MKKCKDNWDPSKPGKHYCGPTTILILIYVDSICSLEYDWDGKEIPIKWWTQDRLKMRADWELENGGFGLGKVRSDKKEQIGEKSTPKDKLYRVERRLEFWIKDRKKIEQELKEIYNIPEVQQGVKNAVKKFEGVFQDKPSWSNGFGDPEKTDLNVTQKIKSVLESLTLENHEQREESEEGFEGNDITGNYNDDEEVDVLEIEKSQKKKVDETLHKSEKSGTRLEADVLDILKSYYNDDDGDEDMLNLEGEKGANKENESRPERQNEVDVLGIEKSQKMKVDHTLHKSEKNGTRLEGGLGETSLKDHTNMDKEENLQIPPTGFSQGNEPDSESDADVLDNLKSYYNDDEGDVDMFNLEGEKGAHKDSKSDADVLDNLKSYYNDDEGDEDMFNLEGEKGAHKGSEADVLEENLDLPPPGFNHGNESGKESKVGDLAMQIDSGKKMKEVEDASKDLAGAEGVQQGEHKNEQESGTPPGCRRSSRGDSRGVQEVTVEEKAARDEGALHGVEGVQEVTEEEKAAGDEGGLPGVERVQEGDNI
ncbi:hypothetical protein QVD17_41263 [Tagetes erecta]|uniref:Uncharacterized protein n=1 Tax=Tagetes erecta TaxID=13708 RepID=A0AAD8NI79_TARER|nr:hypothetical protein QVD17_41263 [Tagetes erecta]